MLLQIGSLSTFERDAQSLWIGIFPSHVGKIRLISFVLERGGGGR